MGALCPDHGNILLRKACENHANVQLVKHAPSLSRAKRNP